jgi:hypothetical protein
MIPKNLTGDNGTGRAGEKSWITLLSPAVHPGAAVGAVVERWEQAWKITVNRTCHQPVIHEFSPMVRSWLSVVISRLERALGLGTKNCGHGLGARSVIGGTG